MKKKPAPASGAKKPIPEDEEEPPAQEGGNRVRAEIREMMTFSPHGVIKDPPSTKLDFVEKTVRTGEGGWFSTRILPCRTSDERSDGVVISSRDISEAKELQAALEDRLRGKPVDLGDTRIELNAEKKRTSNEKPHQT